ncbi:MAG: T9SS type A sorting domain-containing protein [Bacteroidales bacterium]|nr:T9SS type A sorting domain-containing protein [Bacteroidales bacterium]
MESRQTTRLCDIENAEFTDNYCGINATTSNNLVITNNSFNISPKTFTVGGISNLHVEAEALGAFVETSSLPTIENNAFVGTGKTYSLVGLQVKNLGTNNTIINNNSFSGLYAGTQALGYNRGVTQGFIIKGLQYKCNSFLNCSKGIFVTSYGESLSNLFSGIHPNQGSSTQINNNFFALNNDNDIYNLVPYTLTYYYYRISPRNCVGITLTSTTTPGTPCGTIGVTEPTDLLTNNTLGANVLSLIDEENNIDNVGNKTIFDTINEYIEDGQYNTAKTRLQNMEITSENRNEVEDYISYINKIEEYGNSYKIPDNDLIELSTHTTQVGKRASAMVYFKNINREYLPRVVREDEETSSDSSMQNKIQEQIIEKGIEITEEYILTPNPANNEVEIKTTNRGKTTEQHIIPAENTIRQVVILDLQGKELKTFDNTTTFNIAFLKNGTYIVKIKDSENKLHYQKLIKR